MPDMFDLEAFLYHKFCSECGHTHSFKSSFKKGTEFDQYTSISNCMEIVLL